jgi:hypothetical protein
MKITLNQLKEIIAEEVSLAKVGDKDPQRFLHGFDSGHPMDDEGSMIKSRMTDIKDMASTICDLLENEDQIPAWCQDLVAGAHRDLEHVKDYMLGDQKMRDKKVKQQMQPSPMPTAVPMVASEAYMRKFNKLTESFARITEKEMQAWKNGDWGYIQGDDPEPEDL